MNLEFELSRTHLPIAGVYRHAHELPDRPAMVDADTRITFGEFLVRVQQAAARLVAAGVERGDRVAVVAGNSAEFPVAVYAANYLGAIIVPVNFRLAAGEVAYIISDCEPAVVIADADRVLTVRDALAESGDAVPVVDLAVLAASTGESTIPDPVVCAETDDQAIMYTSGTTGRPKGAVLTYSNFLSTTMRSSASWAYVPGRDAVLVASPMFHIAAFNVMTTNIANGAASVITASTGFDAGYLLDVMAEHHVTRTFMVPAQWQLIIDEQRRAPRDVDLRFYSWGAAPATEALLTALRETFPEAMSQAAFGQTETTASGMSLNHEDSVRKLGSVGLPDRNVSVRVVDGQMNDVPQGDVGEIVYRGPGVMDRFWNNEAATEDAFAGGWFHSGDLVKQDEEGYFYVVDRVKDMIISGGENIYCAELENVLAWHPKVAEVAVVGRRDEKWGEVPVAVVVPHSDDEPPTLDDLREFCDGQLARYKMPKDIVLRDAFPRSGTGKIQKNVLRDEV
ncbi:AMP-binding protein [Brevibacterium yomogidense]|uniref:Probable long-chain-fatty-acid--CoA ligase n=1 Tax=Brevibacterium yomogidense TaxID=946573 RepID=A0A1X6WWK2_9MICO|nr:AMP-binding protein [Brevibacterium yomogidense]SLM90103.1 probable long-chain-fatty-acid--CoA ligase [Brevibacterium yomogidense]